MKIRSPKRMIFALVLAGLLCARSAGAAGCATPSFAPARSFLSGGADPFSIAVGDFNGDGTFQPHVDYYSGSDPDSVAVADFNGDGKLDVVVASPPDGAIWVLLGNGDGTFQPAVNYATQTGSGRLAVGDFNGDGKLDVVASGQTGLAVLLGNGDGTFQPPLIDSDVSYSELAVGDFNGDGKADLAASLYANIVVLLGNGDGTFQTPVTNYVGEGVHWITVGDLNGDGLLDLAVAGYPDVVVLLGRGDGTFLPAVKYPLGGKFAPGASPYSVVIGDFNTDGKSDLTVSDTAGGAVSVLLGNGDGTFQPAVRFGVPTGVFSLATADFNGDGITDLATVADGRPSTNGYVAVLLNTCIPPLPTLSIERSNLTAVIDWPLPSSGFVLEFTTNLTSANWQTAPELARTNNGQTEVTVTVDLGERYFRLRKL